MGPKKKKDKKDDKKDELKMIDREFYTIQIEDLNRKLARLESKCAELEAENENIRENMDKLDEDRNDVISHLRRVLQKKIDEVNELTERIDALQMAKETEGALYKEKIKNMENEFKQMHEQLTSEIKLLNGKLNSLEDFRAHREDLMARFERQEQAIEEQEKRHDQQLLDLEQSYLVRKERLKEEMEARLLKLSLDFQKATQMRIASTTQNVIRENIAVNNQLNTLIYEWKKMCEENDALKDYNKNMRMNEEISNNERKIIERKNKLQHELILKLSRNEVKLKEDAELLIQVRKQMSMIECELSEARRCERIAIENLGLTKQHLHMLAVKYNELKVAGNKQQFHSFRLESTLTKASNVVKQVLEMSQFGQSDEGTIIKRAELLKTLEELLDLEETKKQFIIHDPSVETLISCKNTGPVNKYKTGDLGIVPTRKDEPVTAVSIEDNQDMTWDRGDNRISSSIIKARTALKIKYIEEIEDIIQNAKTIITEIRLLPEAKTRLLNDELKERREELLNLLERILDSSLLQTARPQHLPSLESIIIEEGLMKPEFDFPKDIEVIREYSKSSLEPYCQDEKDE